MTLSITLMCQVVSAQAIKIGVLGGLNYSKFKSDLNAGFQSRLGLNTGVMLTKGLNDKLSAKTGLIYKTKNTRFEDVLGGTTQQIELNFEYAYISIPLFVEYQLSSILMLTGGPNLDLNISENYSVSDPSLSINEEANTLIFGLNIGPTLKFKDIEINMLYSKSLTGVSKDAEFAKVLSDETFSGFELNLTYYFF